MMLLVMAVLVAGLMVFMVKNRTQSAVNTGPKVLVANSTIAVGDFMRADGNMKWQEWPQSNISPTYITSDKQKIEDFNGAVARRDMVAGEPINTTSIVKASEGGFMPAVLTPGKRAVSIAVSATSGNAGFIFPGDHVDLILTHRLPGDVLASETFSEDLRVLAIDQMLTNPDNKAVVAKTITLEVTPKQAEKINVAISIGSISVSLRSLSGKDNNAKPPESEDDSQANYSTNADVSKLTTVKTSAGKISVFHGSTAEQIDLNGEKK